MVVFHTHECSVWIGLGEAVSAFECAVVAGILPFAQNKGFQRLNVPLYLTFALAASIDKRCVFGVSFKQLKVFCGVWARLEQPKNRQYAAVRATPSSSHQAVLRTCSWTSSTQSYSGLLEPLFSCRLRKDW